jgi:hypothetical protein
MSHGKACKAGTPSFNQGITNGAAWYPLTGKHLCTQHVENLMFQHELAFNTALTEEYAT